MSWREDLETLACIRERLARAEQLAPEEVKALTAQAEAVVRTARAALRRCEAVVGHLEDALAPSSTDTRGGGLTTEPEA